MNEERNHSVKTVREMLLEIQAQFDYEEETANFWKRIAIESVRSGSLPKSAVECADTVTQEMLQRRLNRWNHPYEVGPDLLAKHLSRFMLQRAKRGANTEDITEDMVGDMQSVVDHLRSLLDQVVKKEESDNGE